MTSCTVKWVLGIEWATKIYIDLKNPILHWQIIYSESRTGNNLYQELSFQEPEALVDVDEGADITGKKICAFWNLGFSVFWGKEMNLSCPKCEFCVVSKSPW